MAIIAFAVLRLQADQIVTGFGINPVALGITTVEVPSQLFNAVPFVACLVARSLFRKGARAPSAIAQPFERKR